MALKLLYPVHTLDRKELLSEGTSLSRETLEKLIAKSPIRRTHRSSLLNYGSVKDDILKFMMRSPYSVIFGHKEKTADAFTLMENVRLGPHLFDVLDFFKEHDFYTYRHILTVFALTALLAQDLIEDSGELMQEVESGPSHDFGKICVPLEILKKTTPLSLGERHILEHHAVAGYVLLSYYLKDHRGLAAKIARDHHERKNGSGYPAGIRLTDRLVEILAASDVYDAIISPRPYRPTSYDNRTALEEIAGMAERGELSWEVVQALVAHNREGRPHYTQVTVSKEKRGTPPSDSVYGIVVEKDMK